MSLSNVIRYVKAIDTSSSTSAGKTGLAFGGIAAAYILQGGQRTTLTPEGITTLGTYEAPSSSAHVRIKEVNAAAPTDGVYEVHLHNDLVAASSKRLWLFFSAGGAAFVPLEIALDALDVADSTELVAIASLLEAAFSTIPGVGGGTFLTQPVDVKTASIDAIAAANLAALLALTKAAVAALDDTTWLRFVLGKLAPLGAATVVPSNSAVVAGEPYPLYVDDDNNEDLGNEIAFAYESALDLTAADVTFGVGETKPTVRALMTLAGEVEQLGPTSWRFAFEATSADKTNLSAYKSYGYTITVTLPSGSSVKIEGECPTRRSWS